MLKSWHGFHQTVIAEIQRIAREQDTDSLSRGTFKSLATISSTVVEKLFGSWNEAVLAAGLKPYPQGGIPRNEQRRLERLREGSLEPASDPRISDRELLDDLIRLKNELGRRPSGNQIEAKGKFRLAAYKKRFGSLDQAYKMTEASRTAVPPQDI